MWWLPVLILALVLAALFIFAWLSLERSKYFNEVQWAKLLERPTPEKPWYIKFFEKRR